MDVLLSMAEDLGPLDFRVSGAQMIVGAVSVGVTALCIALHYEVMNWSSRLLPKVRLRRRSRVVGLILSMLGAHTLEVWIFALTYWGLARWPELGHLTGQFEEGALDFVYFSATVFTNLGFGDMVPTGSLRILTAAEALAGISLMTWSATLAFLEMQKDWAEYRRPKL